MAKATPIVRSDTLCYQHSEQGTQTTQTVTVGTPDWYAWLDTVSTFAFTSEHGTFTARKEQASNRRGGAYWKAYRTYKGRLLHAYLGKSEALTPERLHNVATTLAIRIEEEAGEHEPAIATSPETTKATRYTDGLQVRVTNLPAHLPSLIGRAQEVATVSTLLKQTHTQLVTLTGPGGIGKTSLSLHVATNLLNDFADGVCFVPLAPISDPNLVISTIAQTLGLKSTGNQPALEPLKSFLQSKQLLLVLDNFEQVVVAAPLLTELLADCPRLKILATSREVLRLRNEQVFPIPPLALPDLKQLPDMESLSEYAAIALFIQCAQVVKPNFQLTPANARALAEICTQLDGLPLAIELAAARISLLSSQQLLTRLVRRLQVLTGGTRDLPERHQTLRNTVKWSYDLLNLGEQQLFRQLAIFMGGCTLEAAEAVYGRAIGAERINVLDAISSLLGKHLLQQREVEDGMTRLLMLETIREYAAECLQSSAELEMTRRAHAEYYQALVEESEPNTFDPGEEQWFDSLEREHQNLRAALQWFVEMEEMEAALKLSGSLVRFWGVRGYMHEGCQWLERTLPARERVPLAVRAKALSGAGWLAHEQNDFERSEALCQESLALYKELGDQRGIALSLHRLGGVYARDNYALGCSLLEESLALYRQVGDKGGLAYALMSLGSVNTAYSEYSRAYTPLEESLALFKGMNNREGMAWSLLMLGIVIFHHGDAARAYSLLEESVALFKELHHKEGAARALRVFGQLRLKEGDTARSYLLFEDSLALFRVLGNRQGIAQSLILLGRLHALRGKYVEARVLYEESLAISRELDDQTAITLCLGELQALHAPGASQSVNTPIPHISLTHPAGLSAREVEVLRLVARGLTDAQVAEQLVVSTRTINAHLRSIYSKLGVTSRAAATRYAVEHHIV